MPETEFKKQFELHPETLIEAEEFLREHGDTYETYLASEIASAFDESDVDRIDYREASCSGGETDE
jgi:hypothetical protein